MLLREQSCVRDDPCMVAGIVESVYCKVDVHVCHCVDSQSGLEGCRRLAGARFHARV